MQDSVNPTITNISDNRQNYLPYHHLERGELKIKMSSKNHQGTKNIETKLRISLGRRKKKNMYFFYKTTKLVISLIILE